jgi:hypothetical protein
MLKSLDTSRMYDSIASPILSIHLQARHSLDESSADLTSGVHNSWRLSTWSKKMHGASLFDINEETGHIEVPETGLYLVYAQVIIAGGHANQANHRKPLQNCVTSFHGNH